MRNRTEVRATSIMKPTLIWSLHSNKFWQVFWLPSVLFRLPIGNAPTVTFWNSFGKGYSCRYSFGFTPNSLLIPHNQFENILFGNLKPWQRYTILFVS